ncbi:MAG: protoporphyrinogen oxidase [Candidatus Hydrogenedentes bacterium]|nr:protoporphyrinogen oxidase [Candidatus Hydrogenedentota bacterium]
MRIEVDTAVIGGGVSGLCAAHYLAQSLGRDAVILLEASDCPGGTTRTSAEDGYLLDWGPNGFLNREPKTLQWAEDLGISNKLVTANDAAARRFILKGGRLMEIHPPPRFLATPLLSVLGRVRLCCEPLIRQKANDDPETIWDFAARRIGREAADMMVGPMVSGVFGGDAHQLSLAHCFPRMAAMEREYGSLFKALIAKKRENSAASPVGPSGVLTTFQEGIGFLPMHAASQLGDRVRTNASAVSIKHTNGGFKVQMKDGGEVAARCVVMAAPAFAAVGLLSGMDDALAAALDRIAYAGIAVVCTTYSREAVGHDMNGFGYLVPRNQGKRALGCLWTSSIFPHQAPKDKVLLRSMIGGFTDPDALRLSDSELLDIVAREVHPLLSVSGEPELVRIFRHDRGIPQYLRHHGECLDAVEAAEKRWPGLVFAGNAYRGVGLNDCVLSAHRAADALLK